MKVIIVKPNVIKTAILSRTASKKNIELMKQAWYNEKDTAEVDMDEVFNDYLKRWFNSKKFTTLATFQSAYPFSQFLSERLEK